MGWRGEPLKEHEGSTCSGVLKSSWVSSNADFEMILVWVDIGLLFVCLVLRSSGHLLIQQVRLKNLQGDTSKSFSSQHGNLGTQISMPISTAYVSPDLCFADHSSHPKSTRPRLKVHVDLIYVDVFAHQIHSNSNPSCQNHIDMWSRCEWS